MAISPTSGIRKQDGLTVITGIVKNSGTIDFLVRELGDLSNVHIAVF